MESKAHLWLPGVDTGVRMQHKLNMRLKLQKDLDVTSFYYSALGSDLITWLLDFV